jgi:hypothetical protein
MPEDIDLRNNTRLIPGCDLRAEGGFVVAPPSGNGKGLYSWAEKRGLKDVAPPPIPFLYVEEIQKRVKTIGYSVCPQMSPRDFDVPTYTSKMSPPVPDALAMSPNVPNVPDMSPFDDWTGTTDNSTKMFTVGRRDNDLFHIAWCLTQAKMPVVEMYQTIVQLGRSCGFSESDAMVKANSALARAVKKLSCSADNINDWLETVDGVFSADMIKKDLKIDDRDGRHYLAKHLRRLCEKGAITREGDRCGMYRKIGEAPKEIKWWEADAKEIPLIFPLNVEEWIKVMPRNIIIVAGSPNSGKTAFLLNVVKYNMNKGLVKNPFNYLSSEMADSELKDRLSKFDDVTMAEWRSGVIFKDECINFTEALDPNGINIIDFLEVSDEFWKIGKTLMGIYQKLDQGLAIIALQMKHGAEMGRGAEFSKEKARVYLTMDDNTLTITKGKTWRGSANPNGKCVKFKLVQGAKFISDGFWDDKTVNPKGKK